MEKSKNKALGWTGSQGIHAKAQDTIPNTKATTRPKVV